MPWWRFWEREATDDETPNPPRRTAPVGTVPEPVESLPPPPLSDDARAQRLRRLQSRREGAIFDLERAESAVAPDNPWQERIDLLGESIAIVNADLATARTVTPQPAFALPPTPITGIDVTIEEPAAVRFQIGDESFFFAEEIDWSDRGTSVVRGDLQRQAGDAERLLPADTPPERREALLDQLRASVLVFATDLRDRALDGEALPSGATLADLASPCPVCGGWRNWRGTCDACAQRAWRIQHLEAERARLDAERAREDEDRHTWAERLPVARRRVADIDAEIAQLGG